LVKKFDEDYSFREDMHSLGKFLSNSTRLAEDGPYRKYPQINFKLEKGGESRRPINSQQSACRFLLGKEYEFVPLKF